MEEKRERCSPKRILIDVPEELHHEIKSRALLRNITIRKYVIQAIMTRIQQERKYE